MKIVLVIDGIGKGGAERQLIELASGLKKAGYLVEIFIYRDINRYEEELSKWGIPVKLIPRGRNNVEFIFKFRKEIMLHKPDYVIAFKTIPSIWTFIASLFSKIKVIPSERNIDIKSHDLKSFLFKYLSNNARTITCNSKTARKLLVDNYGISNSKIRVIYNGVDIERFKYIKKNYCEIKNHLNLDDGVINIGFVGRIEAQKNHRLAISAIKELAEQGISVVLHCIGPLNDEKLYDDLVNSILKDNLLDRVSFHKPISKIEDFYKVMDLIVLPSLYEGFPNVVLEAMCSSRIVIASDVSDNAHLIDNNVNGFLFSNNDLDDFVGKIIAYKNLSKDQKKKMEIKAQDTIINNYSKETMVEQYIKLFISKGEVDDI